MEITIYRMGKKKVELGNGVELKFTTRASVDPTGSSETRLAYVGARGSGLHTALTVTSD